MSERVGPATFGKVERHVFLGRDLGVKSPVSERTLQIIDEEIKRIVTEAESRAEEILRSNEDKLHAVARALLEKETISGKELDEILGVGENREETEQKREG